jgi:hypothetical protein
MALHLTDRNVAHQIAERIRTLIARQDDGDITAAARRLERPIVDIYYPERVISSGDEPAAVEFLANVVRSYDADVFWLITGTTTRNRSTVTSEARVTIVEVLGELSDHLLDEARHRDQPTRAGAIPIE